METMTTIVIAGFGASQAALVGFAGLLGLVCAHAVERDERPSVIRVATRGTDAGTRTYPRHDAPSDVLPAQRRRLA